MVQPLATTLALLLATGMALGPGDVVGIADGGDELAPQQVSIELARWEALRAIAELEPEPVKPPGPWVAERMVLIDRAAEGVRIRASWQLETIAPGWWTAPLIRPGSSIAGGMRVESATWRGRPVGIATTPAGEEEVAVEMAAKSRGALELVVFIPAEHLPAGVDGDLDLWLLPAVQGELRWSGITPEGRVAELLADGQSRRAIDGRFWTGEAGLSLRWVDANLPAAELEQPLAVAQTAMGLTFGDGELRGRARVSWLLRRGRLDSVSIDSAGLGGDLELAGPNVQSWSRNGDHIDIVLKEAVEGRIDVDLRWSQAIPSEAETRLAAPRVTPQQAYRSESFMQIARDGELEVLPELGGWSAVARAELPEWAGGFIQGTATASFRRDGEDSGASFELLRFVPLSGPPVMIDVAAYELATSEEGRSLMQARYDVRNERASHLRLELPAGLRMLGVRVNGETVTPTREAGSAGNEAWRIPLVRSLESVKGSLSFPVEVIFIGDEQAWAEKHKEVRELQLPTLDAPVAISRVRVYLPPRYANRVDIGDHHRVESFSEGEGITYGLGVGVGSAEIAQADQLYRDALDRWMANDFRSAQASLDELAQLGASNSNIEGLQANLDLVQGRADGKRDEDESGGGQSAVVSRRIKDQARMRASEDKLELDAKAKEAELLEAQGEYEKAEQKYAEAQEIGDQLALLEQSESQEQMVYNRSLSSSSARVAEKKKRKVSRETVASKGGKADKHGADTSKGKLSYEFGDDVLGGLVDNADGQAPPPPPAPPPTATEMPTDLPQFEPEAPIIAEPEELMDAPESKPKPEPEPEQDPFGANLYVSGNVSEDEETTLDSVDTIVALPGVAARDSGRRPAKQFERRDAPRNARRPLAGRSGKGGAKTPQAAMPVLPAVPLADPNAALDAPVVTASSVTVHIPAIGEAVLYQYMLLPEGQPLSVHLEARRHRKPHP